jgi:hypothetical protein
MSSLSDIFATAKNIVSAINGAAQTYLNVQGAQNRVGLTPNGASPYGTLVKSGVGRIAVVSVTTAGSTVGGVYDCNSIATVSASSVPVNQIYVIPMAIGVYVVNLPVSYGIVVVPGTGMFVTVSYS